MIYFCLKSSLDQHDGLVLCQPVDSLLGVVDAVHLAPAFARHVREVSVLILEPPSPEILEICT